MSYHCVESIATFEHFNLDIDATSSVRLVNYQFEQDTVVENTYPPGLYISMLGKCQCKVLNDKSHQQPNFNHQYVVALVEKQSVSQILFPRNSIWQTFSVMLPLSILKENPTLTTLRDLAPHTVPNIRCAELGPVPSDILRCCEAVWDCQFEGFERELYIKAKAQEVLALFLHKRRIQQPTPSNSRITQLSNLLSHIQTNLAQDWPLDVIANLAGSNKTYIKQDIKALTGTSFHQWLKQTRIEAAREQLASGETITDIAHSVGFKSQAHFATLFKSEIGMPPSEYRQSLIIKQSA